MNLDKKKMPLELSDFGKVILLGEREELILGKGWDGLSESLEIAITRFYRQSKTRVVRSISDQRIPLPGYYAAPHQAVNDFGLVLTENRFGSDGEQTFFEEFPNAAYFIAEGKSKSKGGQFSQLGLLAAQTKGTEEIYLGIDPLFYRVGQRLAIFSSENPESLFSLFQVYYPESSSWKAGLVLRPETRKYEWMDNRTVKSFFPKKKE
ncbi:MAG TPA: hypothetical protein VJA23_00235 [Candidatus Nanoarchaeia archaeon]|nr:hypothetical protein [Candidatus Nanoarchaeia archaeon]